MPYISGHVSKLKLNDGPEGERWLSEADEQGNCTAYVTVADPVSSNNQITAAKRSFPDTFKFLIDNIAHLFANKLDKLTTKPTAGTFTTITINAEGQVTVGGSLVASDIPNLNASKITEGTIDAARLPLSFTTSGNNVKVQSGTGGLYVTLLTIITSAPASTDLNTTIPSTKSMYTALSGKADIEHGHTGYSLTTHSHAYSAIIGTPTIPTAGNGLDSNFNVKAPGPSAYRDGYDHVKAYVGIDNNGLYINLPVMDIGSGYSIFI